MLLPDNLLNPIPGPNPSGRNLRYDPIYDNIKEARRAEDESAPGDWKRDFKKADFALVVKLATDALATKSKDLQIAAWLTEASLRRHGFSGLKEGLELLRALLENFWDSVYPELEEGDAEFRATPLDWVGSRLEEAVKRVPLTKSGLDWFQYKESRAVGYEGDESKKESRKAAVQEGKVTGEAFDEALSVTRKAFYENLMQELDACLESLESLDRVCRQKFGKLAPGFGNLRAGAEEIQQAVRMLLKKKQEQEPDPQPVQEVAQEAVQEAPSEAQALPEDKPQPAAAAKTALPNLEPENPLDAVRRIVEFSRYLRRAEPRSPVPYLIVRALRWGELRTSGSHIDSALLEPPSSETRQQLKRLALEGKWQEVLEAAETAMAMPWGRGWLDLQRYVNKACAELGSSYSSIAAAVCSELKALVVDFPKLPELAFADDTPTANAETQAWIRDEVNPPPPPPGPEPQEVMPQIEMAEDHPAKDSNLAVPDAYELAREAAHGGHEAEAIEILAQAVVQESSGRARFQRKIQLAQVCMATGHEMIARPILEELANEIEQRKLDEWEAADVVAQPLTLLFRCLGKLNQNGEQKDLIYARICRVDPKQALACSE